MSRRRRSFLFQTVLKRPSQSYSFPKQRNLYSTRHELLAIPAAQPGLNDHDIDECEEQESIEGEDEAEEEAEGDNDDGDDFFTPNTSPTATPAPLDPLPLPTTMSPSLSPPHHPISRHPPSSPLTKAFSRATPSIMTSMAVLLDQEHTSINTPSPVKLTSSRHRQPHSHVLISKPTPSSSSSRRSSLDSNSNNSNSNGSNNSNTSSMPKSPAPTNLYRRRSRSLDHHDNITVHSASSSSSTAHIPYAPALPSNGTPGFTSLTLPRAPPPSGLLNSSLESTRVKLDLTLDGLAQTTVASVEVVRGLGRTQTTAGSLFGKFGLTSKKNTSHLPPPVLNGHASGEKILGFTSHRSPPKQVPSTGVLVQVWAVAVDSTDARLVGVRGGNAPKPGLTRSTSLKDRLMRKGTKTGQLQFQLQLQQQEIAEVGYIPGRSFVGRVLESGWDVKDEVVKKGDWVLGLMDVRKGGALTEFVVTDRRRIHRIPQPRMPFNEPEHVEPPPRRPPQSTSGSRSAPSSRSTSTTASSPLNPNSRPSPSRSGSSSSPSAPPSPTRPSKRPNGSSSRSTATSASSITKTPSPLGPGRRPPQSRSSSTPISRPSTPPPPPSLSLEEFALIPLCGIPAYRAVRTLIYAFSSSSSSGKQTYSPQPGGGFDFGTARSKDGGGVGNNTSGSIASEHMTLPPSPDGKIHRRRRVLILRGHDGIGSFAVQLLAKRGWRVSVHAPLPTISLPASISVLGESEDPVELYISAIQARVTKWGGEEVIFDDGGGGGGHLDGITEGSVDTHGGFGFEMDSESTVIRMLEGLRSEGEVFDAILDTIGGKRIWEASERLLRVCGGVGVDEEKKRHGIGQFTTVVGDNPSRVIPTAGDHFRASLRSWRIGGNASDRHSNGNGNDGDSNEHSPTNRSENLNGRYQPKLMVDDSSSTLEGVSLPPSPTTPSLPHPPTSFSIPSAMSLMRSKSTRSTKAAAGGTPTSNGANAGGGGGKVGYAWVSIAQDVDWEGEDIRETLGSVLRLSLKTGGGGIKPYLGHPVGGVVVTRHSPRSNVPSLPASSNKKSTPPLHPPLLSSLPSPEAMAHIENLVEGPRIVSFDQTPTVFVDGGPIISGSTPVVVRVVQ
ncbi:hypothetical protein BDN72DRAFT_50073 [Pluteus cervinus]|uniref:Uncharacterized protein n=1 Tax=Pluteus cervinus TaxID=181527 RepID=A0ACD3BBJ4_9AGAR|nr:hypothetical protein BDN72DRAFT_50073 [Pluteus cervinus]